jgi:hypothetical protein
LELSEKEAMLKVIDDIRTISTMAEAEGLAGSGPLSELAA